VTAAVVTVWRLDADTAARRAARALSQLDRAGWTVLRDSALVVWVGGQRRPTASHLTRDGTEQPLRDPFWSLLVGLVFFAPLVSAATSSGPRDVGGALAAVGVGDMFVNTVRDHVTPGTGALFTLGTEAAADRLEDSALRPAGRIVARLSAGQVALLGEVFGPGSPE